MPSYSKLMERTEFLIDDSMDPVTASNLFNECLEDLSYIARYEKTATGEITDNGFILPEDVIDIIQLIVETRGRQQEAKRASLKDDEWDLDRNQSSAVFFKEFEKKIELFPERSGTYTLRYFAYLPEVNQLNFNEEPPIPRNFHRLLSLYAATRYFDNWEGNPEQRNNYRIQYEALKTELEQYTNRKATRNKQSKVVMARGWYE
jgi:hypothetical protein